MNKIHDVRHVHREKSEDDASRKGDHQAPDGPHERKATSGRVCPASADPRVRRWPTPWVSPYCRVCIELG